MALPQSALSELLDERKTGLGTHWPLPSLRTSMKHSVTATEICLSLRTRS